MMNAELLAEVRAWIADDPDPKTAAQLTALLAADDEITLRKYFSGFLQFGTAGLRGPVGPGPSCMNRAVVGRTAAGIASYMKARAMTRVVIGRDARYGSEDFTEESAQIFAGAGFEVFVLPRPLPTPVLAFATAELKCDVGVMITASHNPPQDNGYKVYVGPTADGINYASSQIITPTDGFIAKEIAAITSLAKLPRGNSWTVLGEEIVTEYVRRTALLANNPGDLKVVYTAMHGVGTETLQRVFNHAGFATLILVDEQSQPDPDFPTVTFPNPEEPGAIDLALEKARDFGADLVIANDPDADRCAVAVNDPKTGWRMLGGDELGVIFGEWIARSRPQGAFGNSIVSSSALRKIAAHYKIDFQEVLTGFKWLAKIDNLAYGYEEAIGYAVDPKTVNDKDGISAAIYLAQIASDLKAQGQTLLDLLDEVWARHGFHATEQISIRVTDMAKISQLLTRLRQNPPSEIAGYKVHAIDDLAAPKDGLPPTDGLRIWLDGDIRIIIRPSGTEAKLKCYIEVITKDAKSAQILLDKLRNPLKEFLS
ncbi:MAG: phospho-sugar mutase [Actinobacteria bacterium]|nr:phospho-sugar mutase [Actinomycetota bacterium]MSV70730.1 phospho-sugar mutase [Actinomycetota bacterium]MSW13230.1 phospho-sugar mutase [Actinomycetota bacterium]MSX46754.1 phospho-sugar mutase [Actinomycetota bacterium]MSX90917.1 phospho-sugar mutase [Actinomycetota bacterium]